MEIKLTKKSMFHQTSESDPAHVSETDTEVQETNARGDLDSEEKIARLVDRFYAKVSVDDVLSPVFNDVAQVNWSTHIPKIARFWNRILLSVPGYEGNPLRAHEHINAQMPFTDAHFARWLQLFEETIAESWSGPKAEHAVRFAHRVAEGHGKYLKDRTESASTSTEL